MLELKNVSISLRLDGRRIADGLDLTLGKSDKAVIIGEEGNGKSTLLKWIYDRAAVEKYCECSGSVKTDARLAYLPQLFDKSLADIKLCDYFDVDYYSQMNLVDRLFPLELLISERKLGELSGGERVKAMLLRILLDEPDVLLLDEPTNDLDIDTLIWLEDFLLQTRIPVLFISHDETLIENTANMILHMEQVVCKTKCKMTVSRCGYREYLEMRTNGIARQSQIAQKQRDDYDKKMDKWRRIYSSVDHAQCTISRSDPAGGRLLKKKMRSVLSQRRRFERQKEEFADYPEVEDAIITRFDPIEFPSGKTVLDLALDKLERQGALLARDVRLTVRGGEHIGITGCNGAGKSTLLDVIWRSLSTRKDIVAAYMPQDYSRALDYDKTPVEYLVANYDKAAVTRARTLLGCMRFTHSEMTNKMGELSGGQRAKILFLEMVLRGANVLLLDEPTRNFSPLSAPVVRECLSEFGGAIISVSHDRKYLEEVCDEVYELTREGLFEI